MTGSLLADSGVDGHVTFALVQGGLAGTYTVRHRAVFNNGRIIDEYPSLEIRNPRTNNLLKVFKYPDDTYEVVTKWTGRFPRGASELADLFVRAYDATEQNVSNTYVSFVTVVEAFSVAKITGGTSGEEILLEYEQNFDNGRRFHEYALLEVRVPPV